MKRSVNCLLKVPDNSFKFYFLRILFSSVLILLIFLYLRFQFTSDIRSFGDSACYIKQSEIPIFNVSFFNFCKPFTVPLFFKIVGSKPENILFGQQLFSVICWTFLGFSLSCFIRNKVLVYLSIIVFSMASLWWVVGVWNYVILSESIFFSLFALWIGSFFLLIHFKNWIWLEFLSLATIFLSFTRSNMPYFLLYFTLILIIPLYLKQNQFNKMRKILMFYLFIVSFFFIMSLTPQFNNEDASRFQLNNVILSRILIEEENLNWFKEKGMPVDDNLLTWKGKPSSAENWDLYRNQTYSSFINWGSHEGRYLYIVYLVSHPSYVIERAWKNRNLIYNYRYSFRIKSTPEHLIFQIASRIWNPGEWTLIIVTLFSLYFFLVFVLKRGNMIQLFLSVLFISLIINAIIVFHADSMEVSRHSLILTIGIYITFICSVFIIFDKLLGTILKSRDLGDFKY